MYPEDAEIIEIVMRREFLSMFSHSIDIVYKYDW